MIDKKVVVLDYEKGKTYIIGLTLKDDFQNEDVEGILQEKYNLSLGMIYYMIVDKAEIEVLE